MTRYLRLWTVLAKFSLSRELAFRANFLVKIFVEVLWLGILIIFYQTLFDKTDDVEGWTQPQFLFFLGCHYMLGGVIETLFLENCNQFADLVRSGDLDFYLLQPIDEQFLVSCRTIDWSCVPNVLLGIALMIFSLTRIENWQWDWLKAGCFSLSILSGITMLYGFMLIMMSASVWLMRNQSLFEMWWLFTTLMRYPREIFRGKWATPVGWFFSFAIPIMLTTNVPVGIMVKIFEPWLVVYVTLSACLLLWLSRKFFFSALRRYRSASS